MDKTQFSVALAIALIVLVGCRRTGPARSGANTTDAPVTDAPEVLSDSLAKSELPERDAPSSSNDPGPNEGTDDLPSKKVRAVESSIQGTKHRILLFPPDGPLLIEFEITVADRPLEGWIDSMLDEATKLADIDGDGQVRWDELYESDELEERYFSDSSVLEEGLDATKQRYDLNNNDLVDRYELPSLLTGGLSSGRSFGLRSSNYYREINRYASPLFRYLDTDAGGSLTAKEIRNATSLLRARDFDNDEYVELSDLPLRDTIDGQTRNNAYQPLVAIWLGPRNPWDRIRLALTELYADGDVLSAEHLTLTPELFGQLDTDKNGRLSLRELAKLTELPPHIGIQIRFSSRVRESQVISSVVLCDSLRRANVRVQAKPAWLTIQFPESRIDLFARDRTIRDPTRQAAELLARVDQDGNQSIDEDEYGAAEFEGVEFEWESEFAELDVDGDQRIVLDEITPLFPPDLNLTDREVRVRAGHRPDALFSAFDANGDWRLAPKELASIVQAVARMDADADGLLTPDELPDHLMVGLTQGGDQRANNLLAQPPGIELQVDPNAPDWFQAMDGNGDGQLSPREFLGRKSQFDRFDKDHDGYLQVDEATP